MPSEDGRISKGQRWAMFCRTGINTQEVNTDYYTAKDLLDQLNQDEASYQEGLKTVLKLGGRLAEGKSPKAFTKYVKGQKKSKKGKKAPKRGVKVSETAAQKRDREYRAIYDRAVASAEASVREMEAPVPMVVQEHANVLDDSSPVIKQYAPVMGGVCGFSWIVVRDARKSFSKWLVKNDLGRSSSYEGGVIIWGEDKKYNGQSMAAKQAWTHGFVQVLREEGIDFYVGSRMD